MLVRQEPAGPAQPGLDLVADQHRAVLVEQVRGRGQEAGRGHVHALALDRLDDQAGHVTLAQLAGQRVEVAERDAAVRQQRAEAAAELGRSVDRQRAGGQAVEGVVAVEDARPAGGVPGELQRGLDRLGAAVAEVRAAHAGDLGEQPLGEQAGQQRAVELDQVGDLAVQQVVQRLADHRVIAAHPEHAEAGQEVGVPVAVAVVEIAALGLLVDLVEPDDAQHAGQVRLEVLVLQLVALASALRQEGGQVEAHTP